MPTFFGNQFNNAYVAQPSVKIPPGDVSGEKKVMYFDYTITAAPTNGDNIKVGKLPAGARVYDAALIFPDLGTAGVLHLGWAAGGSEAADADGFLASVDANAAADAAFMSQAVQAGGQLPGFLKEFASEVDVEIAIPTAWTVTSGTIRGFIEYVTI